MTSNGVANGHAGLPNGVANGGMKQRSHHVLAFTNGNANSTHAVAYSDEEEVGDADHRRQAVHVVVNALKLGACAAGGLVFGFAAEKGKVHIPDVIQNQMAFTQFTMLKMFLSATLAAVGSFVLLSLFPPTKSLFKTVRENFDGCVKPKKEVAFVLGGAILGAGMTLSGACPGMVVIQLGGGVSNAVLTLAGCFTGAVLYGALQPLLHRFLIQHNRQTTSWLDKKLGTNYLSVAVPFAVVLASVALLAECYVPWTSEVPVSPSGVGLLQQKSWSPIFAGLLMGSLQLVVAFAVEDSLGGSSSYCTVLSQAGLRKWVSYFTDFHKGIGNWWQVAYWLGALGGATLSAHLSGSFGDGVGVAPWAGFVGGTMLLFGARMASGCTSGHGLSGMALLSNPAFLTVPAMFAGGMGLSFIQRLYFS